MEHDQIKNKYERAAELLEGNNLVANPNYDIDPQELYDAKELAIHVLRQCIGKTKDTRIKTFKEWFEEFGIDYIDIWGESDDDPSNSQWSFTTDAVNKMIDAYETEVNSIELCQSQIDE